MGWKHLHIFLSNLRNLKCNSAFALDLFVLGIILSKPFKDQMQPSLEINITQYIYTISHSTILQTLIATDYVYFCMNVLSHIRKYTVLTSFIQVIGTMFKNQEEGSLSTFLWKKHFKSFMSIFR